MASDREVSETIDNFIERLQTSTLPQDRRDACRGLKFMAKDYQVEASLAMQVLLDILAKDRHDIDLTIDCLDSLNYIISGEIRELLAGPAATWPDPEPEQTSSSGDPYHQRSIPACPSRELAEIFLKQKENVMVILDCLDNENHFNIRWRAIKLLCGLCRHKLTTVQSVILCIPLAVTRLTGLLGDEDERLRNDALALFVKLARSDNQIQNIFVFDSGFYKLMEIIEKEGYLSGTAAVVMDVLCIILNLLQTNEINRKLFYDGDFLPKLIPFFDGIQEMQWNDGHKMTCIICVLQILHTMITSNDSSIDVFDLKKKLFDSGIAYKMDQILSSRELPISVLYETLNTASDLFRGSNPERMVPAQSMIPILSLSIVKDTIHEQDRRLSEYQIKAERRISEQERSLTDLRSYVTELYEFIKEMSCKTTTNNLSNNNQS